MIKGYIEAEIMAQTIVKNSFYYTRYDIQRASDLCPEHGMAGDLMKDLLTFDIADFTERLEEITKQLMKLEISNEKITGNRRNIRAVLAAKLRERMGTSDSDGGV